MTVHSELLPLCETLYVAIHHSINKLVVSHFSVFGSMMCGSDTQYIGQQRSDVWACRTVT